MVWIYFMCEKFDVFSTFKKWKTQVETQIRNKINYLWFNNGGEYMSKVFEYYYAIEGIT